MTRDVPRLLTYAIGAVLCLTGTPRALRADRDIVYAGQYYRWSNNYYHSPEGGKPEQTPEEKGPSHLYLIDPDGTRRLQLTHSNRNDYGPRWSPDGKRILFLRERAEASDGENEPLDLLVCSADGSGVRTLAHLHTYEYYYPRYGWSPDGRWVAFDGYDPGKKKGFTCLYDIQTGKQRSLPSAFSFAWSPNSQQLILEEENDPSRNSLYSLQTGRLTRVADPVRNPVWISNTEVMGQWLKQGNQELGLRYLRFLGTDGKGKRTLKMRLQPTKSQRYNELPDYEEGRWTPIPGSPTRWLLETRWGMSDGVHFACYQVDIRAGVVSYLAEGRFCGISPRGDYVLVADRDWIGPYKRGGRRGGPLQRVSLRSHWTRTLTTKMVSIAGGDWRLPHVQ